MVPGKRWKLTPSWVFMALAPIGLPCPLSRCSLEKPRCVLVGGGVGRWEEDPIPAPMLREEDPCLSLYPSTTASLRCLHRPILRMGKTRHEECHCFNEKLLQEGF